MDKVDKVVPERPGLGQEEGVEESPRVVGQRTEDMGEPEATVSEGTTT